MSSHHPVGVRRCFALFVVGLLTAGCSGCREGSTVADAGREVGGDVIPYVDAGVDLRPDMDTRCGGKRILTPTPVTRGVGQPCGTGCRQITFGPYASLRYEVQDDILVYSEESLFQEERVYMVDLARDEEWIVRVPYFRGRPGCFWVSTDGKRLAYGCQIWPKPSSDLVEAIHLYDPVTHEEQDLECIPLMVGKSSAISDLTLGSTGIAARLSVTSIAPYAWFHNFSDGSFSEVSASAAWFTHMSGTRLVWAEAMAQSQIVLYDTVTKVKTVLDPQPHGQWLPRIDGDRIVWVDHRNAPGDMVNQGNSDIYLHDLSTGKTTPVTINPARQDHPDVDGDWVVWEDWRNNPNPTPKNAGEFKESDIFALNLKTGKEIQVTNLPGMELNPKVDGDRVFYIKGPFIFMKDLR